MLKVHKIEAGGFNSNIYLIIGKKILIIDTGLPAYGERILRTLKYIISGEPSFRDLPLESAVEGVVLTHFHFDHSGNGSLFSRELKCRVFAHQNGVGILASGGDEILASAFGSRFEPLDPLGTSGIEEGYTFMLGDEEPDRVQVLHTPGHTSDSISLYLPASKVLFCGDLMFAGGAVGRTDLPTGDEGKLRESLKKLTLYDIKTIHPGHGNSIIADANNYIHALSEGFW